MRLLLDSQIVFWGLFRPNTLPANLQAAILEPANALFVSAITPYELETKKAAGRLGFPDVPDWRRAVAHLGAEMLPIATEHGVAAARLPRLHGDPWDRLLIGQAQVEALTLATTDSDIARYTIAVLS